ncbi:MAG: metallophosphoesterase family protein [Microthrixaceae bacterium]
MTLWSERSTNEEISDALRQSVPSVGAAPTRTLVLADTHIRPSSSRDLPDEVWDAAERADVILHAGDVLTSDLLVRLAELAPVHAVLGNNDVTLSPDLPETLSMDLGGVRVAMLHDSGTRVGRHARLYRRFPEAQVVVYGHSHLPDDSEGEAGQRIFNPGSCTERRRAPHRTYGWLELADGHVIEHRIIPVL